MRKVLGRDKAHGFISDCITAHIPTVNSRFSSGELNSLLHYFMGSRWPIFCAALWTTLTFQVNRPGFNGDFVYVLSANSSCAMVFRAPECAGPPTRSAL